MTTQNETAFRIVFGILWIVYFAVRLYFQRKVQGARRQYERVNEKQEKRLFGLFALAYFVLPLYFLTPWVDFAHLPLPAWLRWTGGGGVVLGIALFGWAHQALGMNWTAVLALSQEHQLVTHGPFRFMRHPMYSAFFVIGFGFLLLSANWLISAFYFGTLIAMYAARVSAEETMMVERFGDAYREYMKKTGRLFPRLF